MLMPLQVLLIEDSDDDIELTLNHLFKAGFAVTSQNVETPDAMRAALEQGHWDIIISDYSLPAFSAPSALLILQKSGLDIPFIVVSGTISEETAIGLMRMGASDYLLKDRLARLGPLVTRELHFAEIRKQRRETQTALQISQDWTNLIYNSASDAMFLLAVEKNGGFHCLSANEAFLRSTGLAKEQVIGKRPAHWFPPEKAKFILEKYQEAIQARRPIQYEDSVELSGGELVVDTTLTPIFDKEGNCTHLLSTSHEITGRKLPKTSHQEKEPGENLTDKEAMARQNNLLDTLLRTLPIGIFMVEAPSGRPLVANEAARAFLGRGILPDANKENIGEVYEAYKLPGREKYPPEEMPIILGMEGISSHIEDMLVVRPDKSWVLLEVTGSPVMDANGKIWASLVSFQDISKRKQAEEQLREQLEELRRWQAVTLGRERRILELKAEVNQLLRDAGLPERYLSVQEKAEG